MTRHIRAWTCRCWSRVVVEMDARASTVAFAAVVAAVAAMSVSAAPTRSVDTAYALAGGTLDRPSRLLALDPATLAIRQRGPLLPSWAFGVVYARSADGQRLAVLPKPSDTADHLFLVDAATLRVTHVVVLGESACDASWLDSRRLLVVVAEPICHPYRPTPAHLSAVIVDARSGRIVSRHAVSGSWSLLASAAVRSGLLELAAPARGPGGLRLIYASASGPRTILLGLPYRSRDTVAVAATPTSSSAYVVAPGWQIARISLSTGAVRRHKLKLRFPASERPRHLSAPTDRPLGRVVTAAVVNGRLVIAGGVAHGHVITPGGAYLVNTATWLPRLLQADASGIATTSSRIVAYGPSSMSVYDTHGLLLYRTPVGLTVLRIAFGYAYLSDASGHAHALDVRTGKEGARPVSARLPAGLLTGLDGH